MQSFPKQSQLESTYPSRFYRLRGIRPGLYIITYHSIFDESQAEAWERAYTKIATPVTHFADHIDWLHHHMTPLSLSDSLSLQDFTQQAYFAIHFDDGYQTLVKNALPILRAYPVRPAVFVNGAFASGQKIYYRVLAALMTAQHQTQALIEQLTRHGFIPPNHPEQLFDFLKNQYRYPDTEQAVEHAWETANSGYPAAHLDWTGLRQLTEQGWEIANHTLTHANLVDLSLADHDTQILDNERLIGGAGFDPLPVIGYPNGAVRHVSQLTHTWLENHPQYHGMFGNGGVNLHSSRMEWFRIGVGDWSLKHFIRQLKREADRAYQLS